MFQNLNLEELGSEKERVTNNSSNHFLDQFVAMPKEAGVIAVRLLPPLEGKCLYQYNRIHTINGRRVHCRKPLNNGKWDRTVKCPICDYYQSLWKQADRCDAEGNRQEAEAFKDEARLLKPNERYYYNVIVRQVPNQLGEIETNVGPRILSVGKWLHRLIITGILGDAQGPGLGNVCHLQSGFDLIIRKEIKGGFADYGKSHFAQTSSAAGSKDEIARWVENMHDLTALRNPKTVEELEKEIAIYRKIIPDDSDYDVDALEAKFRPKEIDGSIDSSAKVTEVTHESPLDTGSGDSASDSEGSTSNGLQSLDDLDEPVDEDFMKCILKA